MITTIMSYCSFSLVGAKVNYELKYRYLKSILTKDEEWYESQNVSQLPTQVFTNLTEAENASGVTVSFIIVSAATMIAGVATMFYCSILLGLVNLIIVPYIMI
jgi:ABC-type multidrug transport system fused ATPase/permease subunit